MLRAGRALVVCALRVERRHAVGDLGGRVGHDVIKVRLLACGFRRASLGCGAESSHQVRSLQSTAQSFAEQPSHICSTDGSNCPYPLIGACSEGNISTASTDTQRTNTLRVNLSTGSKKRDRGLDVLSTLGRVLKVARLTTAGALVRRVKGEGDEASLAKQLCVEAGRLFLDAAKGVADDDGGTAALVGSGDEDVSGNVDALAGERDCFCFGHGKGIEL